MANSQIGFFGLGLKDQGRNENSIEEDFDASRSVALQNRFVKEEFQFKDSMLLRDSKSLMCMFGKNVTKKRFKSLGGSKSPFETLKQKSQLSQTQTTEPFEEVLTFSKSNSFGTSQLSQQSKLLRTSYDKGRFRLTQDLQSTSYTNSNTCPSANRGQSLMSATGFSTSSNHHNNNNNNWRVVGDYQSRDNSILTLTKRNSKRDITQTSESGDDYVLQAKDFDRQSSVAANHKMNSSLEKFKMNASNLSFKRKEESAFRISNTPLKSRLDSDVSSQVCQEYTLFLDGCL